MTRTLLVQLLGRAGIEESVSTDTDRISVQALPVIRVAVANLATRADRTTSAHITFDSRVVDVRLLLPDVGGLVGTAGFQQSRGIVRKRLKRCSVKAL